MWQITSIDRAIFRSLFLEGSHSILIPNMIVKAPLFMTQRCNFYLLLWGANVLYHTKKHKLFQIFSFFHWQKFQQKCSHMRFLHVQNICLISALTRCRIATASVCSLWGPWLTGTGRRGKGRSLKESPKGNSDYNSGRQACKDSVSNV